MRGLTQAFLMVTELELPLKHRQKGKAAPGEERACAKEWSPVWLEKNSSREVAAKAGDPGPGAMLPNQGFST